MQLRPGWRPAGATDARREGGPAPINAWSDSGTTNGMPRPVFAGNGASCGLTELRALNLDPLERGNSIDAIAITAGRSRALVTK